MTPKQYDEFMDEINAKEKSFKIIASKVNYKLMSSENNNNSFSTSMTQNEALSKVEGYKSKLNTMKKY